MTASFAHYDTRGYRTLDVVAGYAVWAPFYDTTMDDRLDLPLLRSLVSVDWSGITAATAMMSSSPLLLPVTSPTLLRSMPRLRASHARAARSSWSTTIRSCC